MIRRLVPQCLLPLAMIAGVLAATPWLHSFPASAIGVPVFGAAVLSVLVPAVAVQLGVTRMWLSLLIDLICFVVYALVVALHDPIGFSKLGEGLYHGPSQILTFALPLVSPRSLFVAPVALAWVAGALAGECLTRRWFTVLPYPGFLVAYGLAYAGTSRSANFVTSAARVDRTLISALLLMTLLLLRVAQTWVRQDETAESTQADGILPLRSITVGLLSTIAVTGIAALVVQSAPFTGRSAAPQRVPSVHDSRPLSPVSFISSLRPSDPTAAGTPVFTVQTDRASPGYFSIANADDYDGAGWSFSRTFRPSGGVLPDESDTELDGPQATVTQTYRIADGPLVGAPWMPYVYRPQRVAGASINIDQDSGMIVPAGQLREDQRYRVTSRVPRGSFAKLAASASIATGTASNGNLPSGLNQTLSTLARSFSQETGTSLTPAVGFLQALQKDLQGNYSLSGGTASGSAGPGTSSPRAPSTGTAAASRTVTKPASASATATAPPTTIPPGARAGSTSFADVLASVVGPDRTGSPQQYATIVALIAREIGVPARVVSGFRVKAPTGSTLLPSGTYTVTTAQAWTWVEIPVVGNGWMILDAAPSTYSSVRETPTVAASASPSPTATPTQNELLTKSNGGHAVAPKSHVPAGSQSSIRTAVATLIIVLGALLVLVLVVLLLRKQLRRQRRRRLTDPRARALAAWQESIDVLSEAGLPELNSLTGTEIGALAEERFGADPAGQVGRLSATAAVAAYSTMVISPEQADDAWTSERTLRRQVRQQLPFGARLTYWLRYHRTRSPRTPVGPRSWVAEAAQREQTRQQARRRTRRHAKHRA